MSLKSVWPLVFLKYTSNLYITIVLLSAQTFAECDFSFHISFTEFMWMEGITHQVRVKVFLELL